VQTPTRFIAAAVASISLAFIPTAAQAIVEDPTTVAVTVGGVAPTSMQQEDQLDIVTRGPIAQIGASIHTLSTAWSTQSLHLLGTGKYDADTNPNGIIVPQGWSLQYSTDGTNFSNDAPADTSTIVAVRSRGDVTTTGRGRFQTTSAAQEVTTVGAFGGGSAGDGYNVGFGSHFLVNSWHHSNSLPAPNANTLNIECHLMDGSECADYIYTVPGYQTALASSVFVTKSNDHVYEYVRRVSDGAVGVFCLDYSDLDINDVSMCSTPFTVLASSSLGVFANTGSGVTQNGTKIWAIDSKTGNLMCYDMSTDLACPDDNGVNIGSAGTRVDGLIKDRVSAIEGKIYFTVNNKFGCYDPSTHDLCGNPDSTPVDIPNATNTTLGFNRHAPMPIYSTTGTFLGACDINSKTCIDDTGASATMPSGLSAYFTSTGTNNVVAGQNAEQWAVNGTKFYYPGPGIPTSGYWSHTLICWDYSTDALCSGWAGNDSGIYYPYTASIDPDNPGCVWLNQDNGGGIGKIMPFDATTGEVGCSFGDPVIELPYSSVVPRMACQGTGRVTAWSELALNLGSLTSSDVAVSIFDSNGTVISGWDGLTPDSDGKVDLTTLSVTDTGLTPSIRITGLGDVSMDTLLNVTGTVTYDADEPEMCLSLVAATNCPDASMNIPAVPDVPAGIVEGASVTTPTGAGSDVGSHARTTIAGTNSGKLCAASIIGDATTTPELAATGFDPGGLALGGFAALAVGLGAVVVRRRRNGVSR
jgi:LPXTG-motif cell wall-anchored protein